jgi:hypothetical protein
MEARFNNPNLFSPFHTYTIITKPVAKPLLRSLLPWTSQDIPTITGDGDFAARTIPGLEELALMRIARMLLRRKLPQLRLLDRPSRKRIL